MIDEGNFNYQLMNLAIEIQNSFRKKNRKTYL